MTIATGFNAMGKHVPYERRQRAYEAAKSMGLDSDGAMQLVDWISEQLRRDKPYEALHGALERGIDLTGAYRLMATLLT